MEKERKKADSITKFKQLHKTGFNGGTTTRKGQRFNEGTIT